MRKTSLFALTTVSVAALTVGAAPAVAQGTVPESCAGIADEAQKQACADAAEQTDPNANSGDQATSPTAGGVASAEATPGGSEEAIVVTGSRLRRDERTSADPITVIDPNNSNRSGQFDTAEILQTSPLAAGSTQITSVISSNFVVNGGEGAQTISLRGLGANRTLVLLNGRRAGPAGTRGGVSAFDLNVIPQDAIQSVEILKTGASSVYGSDAIAGVVNLITKKDLEGFRFSSFVTAPQEGGGEQYSISGTYGLRLGSRGHISLSANYYHMNELERRDRDYLGCTGEYVFRESDGTRADPIDVRTGLPSCQAFSTNYIALADVGLMRSSNLFGPVLPDATPPAGQRRPITVITFAPELQSILANENGLFFNTSPTNPTQFRAPAGFVPVGGHTRTALGVFPDDPRAYTDSVYPETKRLTFYGEAGYDLSDNVELYFEGLYNRRKTRTDASGQIFFTAFPQVGETVYSEVFGAYYLPYFFCQGGLGSEQCNPNARGDPINTGITGGAMLTPVVYRPFNSSSDVEYIRGVAGLRANLESILPKGFLDFYFQHSQSDGSYTRDVTFRDAIEFGVAEFRTQSCVGTVTAIRGVPCIDINYTDPRVLRGDFTAAERAFLFTTDTGNTKYTQDVAELSFGGDLFDLPGGPVRFALGGQWRRDKINDVPGPVTQAGNSFGATGAGVTAGHQRTIEAFGEIGLPLLRDVPGFYELSLNGAARLTSTKAVRSDGASDSDSGNWTYKVGIEWAPVKPIRFRATYGTSFRSPALFEQFLNNETGFLGQATIDPCINFQFSDNAELQANCAADGIPPDYLGVGGSAETRSQGNVGQLDPETSRAITASVIFTPDGWFWDGAQFSLTVDYIDIKVKDQVTQLGAANILAACYTSDFFPTDPLCSLFTRDNNPQSGTAFNVLTVDDPYFNIDQQHNKSLDVTTRFRQDMGKLGTLSLVGQLTYQLRDKFQLFQGTINSDNGESGDPKWIGDLDVNWTKGPITVTYGLQVIASTSDLADLVQVGGTQLTANNCIASNAAFALRDGPYCPVYKLPRTAYHSLSAEIQATDRFSFLIGVANLFDKEPPRVSTVAPPIATFYQVPQLGTYYDYFGRRLFASARFRF